METSGHQEKERKELSRRNFLKFAGGTMAALAAIPSFGRLIAHARENGHDIGIIGSTDILAADQACIDLIYQMPDNERYDIVERVESRLGLHQLEYMEVLGMGSRETSFNDPLTDSQHPIL
ncbi:twin-arginine translocation signal domain-containing protein [Sporomusa acidovorans]|uniref:Twin-arginine translocation signal domain-containing protein n=1 Tax=Sporomusa acidovorans (strain ATCC 49682 / DSM 3132 / Mol) TaxID=1123286 RepID=A0ABZ3IWY8_SPOA4|nr:twin-arginine translocation signal domain-containing protein [Sporomusa acidovorans]OZC23391.1 hypothetical protein SPACI_08030 [Sporomusa acidovorans DSM 3132]SDE44030.1 Tat (twin-arginine translocation) pathway signal sequence [Sporomusa acidovorans]